MKRANGAAEAQFGAIQSSVEEQPETLTDGEGKSEACNLRKGVQTEVRKQFSCQNRRLLWVASLVMYRQVLVMHHDERNAEKLIIRNSGH